ncbi:hypothetical protein G3T14_00510 [Methylobacterium sp. BTF04]|uniref:hypothetical protein n=1 Tax=Methylobacterium sp. BTF04 TaxID=2708300 RepID=UPI0013D2596D|nr:hypothetical protein [Methylobacterium sp. BTF04]NEU10609.1 hypothetical protein [Methylobacterium sp. BTF04]
MNRTDIPARAFRAIDGRRAEIGLERSVADTLRVIAAACAERNAPPIKAARQHMAEIYGATRLSRQRERRRASA